MLKVHLDLTRNPISKTILHTEKVCNAYILKSNNKFYIGSSTDTYTRLCKHKSLLSRNTHWNKDFQESFNENNEIDVLFLECKNKEEAFQVEQELLNINKDNNNLFNVASDAKRSQFGRPHSLETIEKIRRPQSEESRRKMSETKLSKSPKISIEGKIYNNIHEIMDVYCLNYSVVWSRLNSDKFLNWFKII